jgi:hypothetical protein
MYCIFDRRNPWRVDKWKPKLKGKIKKGGIHGKA